MEDDPRIHELRALGATIGEMVYFGPTVYVEKSFAELLEIGDGVVLSQGTTILLHDSSLNNVCGAPIKFGRVKIGDHAYIGANTTIMCGTEIGPRALIGACSLVTTDLPADHLSFGTPARPIRPVAEVAERQAQRMRSGEHPATFELPAEPWRDRTEASYPDFDRRVQEAFAAFAASGAGRTTGAGA